MLQHLRIENYALIRSLDVDITSGFCVITGETGAGKSILLGALNLVLGQRADSGILFDAEKKCVIEAHFDTTGIDLRRFLQENDIETETGDPLLILRREIWPGGKSRAFINDSPVTLPVLKELAQSLIDIHSQHETLTLGHSDFQLQLLDSYLDDKALLPRYAEVYGKYEKARRLLALAEEKYRKGQQEQDYRQFLYEELERLNLQAGEQKKMEDVLERLAHAELLKNTLASSVAELDGEEHSLRSRLENMVRGFQKIAAYHPGVAANMERWKSLLAELADLGSDLARWAEEEETDPECKSRYEERLDMLYRLERKHQVEDEAGLIEIRDRLAEEIAFVSDAGGEIAQLKADLACMENELHSISLEIHRLRESAALKLQKAILEALSGLGMAQSNIEIRFTETGRFTATGTDHIEFMFSANIGSAPRELAKVASGGELSRLMLAIKSVIHQRNLLGTIIFDEIDTGVSGQIAGKVAMMMRNMSRYMQVIAITHLPQIAAVADTHFYVSKAEENGRTVSGIRLLSEADHLHAIASMLSNDRITEAALQAAGELIKDRK